MCFNYYYYYYLFIIIIIIIVVVVVIESLVIVPISQSSALQRSGRAGRVRSGKVYRLYTGKS